ncbi:putative reverse transcriptase domain-containing protein [Tanacetum coccineum]
MAPTTRRGPNTPVKNTNPNNMTPESIQAMIDQDLLQNSTNRDGSHSSHGDNRRNVQTVRPCFYEDFMKCQPLNFKGTEGVVGLTRWIEKMESVFNISGCAIENQVKFATCTLLGAALTWWNGQIRTLGPEAYAMTWEILKKKMTDKYCLQGEIKKLEIELWNLKVKGNDVPANTKRFQELTMICTKFVANKTEKVDKYISGIPDNIYGNVKSARLKTLNETIELANDLMDQKLRTYAERQSDNKRKADDSSRNNHGHQQQPFKRQNVAKVYNMGTGERKPYGGYLPKYTKCHLHHNGPCTQKCHKCNKVGHFARDCRSTGHFKRDCPKLKNKDGGNGNAQGWVYAVGNAEKRGNASGNPNVNVVTAPPGRRCRDGRELVSGNIPCQLFPEFYFHLVYPEQSVPADVVEYTITSSDKAALNEFDQKQALFETMTTSKSFNKHPKHKALYHALMESILADEDAMDQGVADEQKKRKPANDDRDEDPPDRPDQGLKRRKTSKDAEPSKRSKSTGSSKGNTPSQPKSKCIGKSVYAEETIYEAKVTETPHNQGDDMAKAGTPPTTFDELMSSPIDFSAFAMNCLQITNLTKAILRGGSTDRKYTASITKTKAAKYDLKGIEDMVPMLWSPIKVTYDKHAALGTSHSGPKRQRFYRYATNKVSKHDVYSTKRILAVTNVKVNKWYGYGHLEEIEVRRVDQQLYKFMEGDFPRLHLNDIKDMLLLVKRVEDLQLGVESYQKKLNISKLRTRDEDLSRKAPYTTLSDPQGVIYEDKLNKKRLMHSDELHKFSDGTLQSVRDTLHDMANNLRMGYNKVIPRRRWSNVDKKRSHIMVKDIDQQLMERRLMRSLEKFVGGREYGNDLRLLQQTI